jgi:quinol-cytochrome oxidoreductase complex cytochrome b subunit
MSTTTQGRAPEMAPAPAPEKRGLVDWVVQRLGLTATMEDQYNRIVPKHATNYIYCFGGIAFVLFIILAATGILLSVYYQPTPDTAYQSVLNISTHVQFGWWIRSIHRWSAGAMVLLVFIHTLRVFFTGAYKAPRELNWLTGVLLLLITLGFGFTGYLLPWDQKAYWATKVGTDIAGSVPFIGRFLLVTLRGGEQISAATLGRFFTLHVLVLPAIIVALLLGHFWMIRRHGISGRL